MQFPMDHLLVTRRKIKRGHIIARRRATQRIINSSQRKPNLREIVGSARNMGTRRQIVSNLRSGLIKERTLLALVFFESNIIDVPSNTQWLDTSATIHVTNSLQALRNLRKPSDGELIIQLGNGDKVEVEHIRDISLELSI